MAKSVGDYEIPFDRDGNQQHYPDSWWGGEYPKGQRVNALLKAAVGRTLTYKALIEK